MPETSAPQGLIVAGGGTGGHVLAGVAIADAWKAEHAQRGGSTVDFVGATGGIEVKLVPRAGYPLQLLKVGSLKGVGALKRLRTLFLLPLAFIKSAIILLRIRPRAVIGVGGYASGPLVLMARILQPLLKARVAVLEQNAVPGLTNRILAKLSDLVFVAFPGVEARFPGKRCIFTGNPVRSTLTRMPSAPRSPFVVFVFGGSQGAMGINSLVIEALKQLEDLKGKIEWIHQTGERDYPRVAAAHAGWNSRVEKFIYEMPECYRKSSLLICRAGSGTLSEIASIGRASILIPFPQAADDHQTKNAEIFVRGGASILLPQADAQAGDLAAEIRRLIARPGDLSTMEEAAHRLYRSGSAQAIVRNLME